VQHGVDLVLADGTAVVADDLLLAAVHEVAAVGVVVRRAGRGVEVDGGLDGVDLVSHRLDAVAEGVGQVEGQGQVARRDVLLTLAFAAQVQRLIVDPSA
jgi:hypothetical protein